jgi:FHA domain
MTTAQLVLNWIIQAVIAFLFGGAGAFIAVRYLLRSEKGGAAVQPAGRKQELPMTGPLPPAPVAGATASAGGAWLQGQPPAGSFGLLCVSKGPLLGRMFKVEDGQTIGRTDANLVLEDPKVSGMHAKLAIQGGQCTITDHASTNGTWVNDKRIRQPAHLQENDLVRIGDTIFMFKSFQKESDQKSPTVPAMRK